jgi:hypothetical protein
MNDAAPETFEEYVERWAKVGDEIAKLTAQKVALTADIDARIKALAPTEMEMRKAIAVSVKTALGEKAKEGVNHWTLPDGRKLKLTLNKTRKIAEPEIKNARAAFELLNEEQPVAFDALLRTKYELEKKEWNKLGDAAKLAISRMITTTDDAPIVEFN